MVSYYVDSSLPFVMTRPKADDRLLSIRVGTHFDFMFPWTFIYKP